ncbi:uncharacterized protein LOC106129448 isoform X1 [Amyelois transitella]|uniref:uncharacterized protein LOC106129448 isoform X1 n=2 Tax=Amyelois transitella TaxID=680683 RepID=UPI0029900F61|nr:uncharacterized protein LOC106129448 isoform X1 [Amyelois transitella]
MNQESVNKSGGPSITPSARRSIHSHNNCIFAHTPIMGRYGLKNEEVVRRNEHNTKSLKKVDEGFDEVDNVMSKLCKPSSPLRVTQKTSPRRYSLSVENRQDPPVSDDESDLSNVLAKSLPATLPSNCSGEFGDWSVQSDLINYSNQRRTPESCRINHHEERPNRICTKYNYEEERREEARVQNSRKPSKSFLFVPAAAAFGIIATLFSGLLSESQLSNIIVYDEFEYYNDLSDLGRKYKVTDDTILQVQTGISTIYKRQDAGSFVFAYNSNSDRFDPDQFNKFMDDIALSTARYLRNDSASVGHTTVNSLALKMESHSELIKTYKDDVDRSGVMLVKEIDTVPSKLAMAFHYYCDEYNPLVRRSAIFFTLNMAKCSDMSDSRSIFARIEKCLKKKWNGGVPQDNIGPLLTRVVASVIDVTNI